MKYQRLLGLLIIVLAVAASVPGCGKKDEEGDINNGGGGGSGTTYGNNGFSRQGGMGQASILSDSRCYDVIFDGNKEVRFPIATSPEPEYSGYKSLNNMLLFVASTVYEGGNHYRTQSSYGDWINIFTDGSHVSGEIFLDRETVEAIQRELSYYYRLENDRLCIDGAVVQAYNNGGNTLNGCIWVYVEGAPFLIFESTGSSCPAWPYF